MLRHCNDRKQDLRHKLIKHQPAHSASSSPDQPYPYRFPGGNLQHGPINCFSVSAYLLVDRINDRLNIYIIASC